MLLKPYQATTLAILRRFLEQARIAGPAGAYAAITGEVAQAARLGRWRGEYRPLAGLPGVPYVCLRLPTGGGKTILAAHAVALARDAWMERDFPLVLWLVPSNTIRRQTVEALRTPRHPYRQAIDEQFDGRVRVFDIADFTDLRPHDIAANACIVVGTIQTLRVTNTEGRKVYAHNENMEPHFTTIPAGTPGLEQRDGRTDTVGDPRFSFANLLHVRRPLMIVDEAHGAVTGLSREMQARVNPCAIIEFTATPRTNSNILHSVTAQELKAADMVKLPIVLAEHDSWQAAVSGAIASRAALAEAAKGETGYIRPIVLFQAQNRDREVNVEALRRHLVEVEQVPEHRIAIATGDQRELDGIDLFDPHCPIEFIITVEALKEGWDCSFAYVFCSVSRIQSATDVEQLLGRVLRMPYAARRTAEALNRAYAHVSEPSFGEAARALVDRLVAMGFDEQEAQQAIEPAQGSLDDTGLFRPRERPPPVFRFSLAAAPDAIASLEAAAQQAGVSIVPQADGTVAITATGHLAPEAETALAAALPESARRGFAEAAQAWRLGLSPAERGESFAVPGLAAWVQGEFQLADTDLFMEDHDWSLAAHPARLDEAGFAIRETARSFEIDVDGSRVSYQYAGEDRQLALDVAAEGWTRENLVLWLERQLRERDIHPSDLLRWLSDSVGHLLGPRRIPIAALMRAKFVLARKLRECLKAARQAERRAAYQRRLFAPDARVEVSPEHGFRFHAGMYGDVRMQGAGGWRPRRHYLGADRMPAFDGVEGGEEMRCAEALDSLPQVKFWLRNVARHDDSFWLPTATDKFYPDFVARLTDGRLMIAEYKGEHLATGDDSHEKRVVGRLWEQQGGGLFIMVEKRLGNRDMHAQLRDKIGP